MIGPVQATTSISPALEIRHLTKRYGERLALNDVSLVVPPATVLGLLGPNGAGKTTLMRTVLGLVAPDAGTMRISGTTHLAAGAVPDGVAGFVDVPRFYPFLTGRQNLDLLARLDDAAVEGAERVRRSIETAAVSPFVDRRVEQYSAGMRQRLAIAAALLRAPRLLLLDEPTSSLDPAGARDVRALVRRLAAEGAAVIVSSHDMTEIEALCSLVTVLDQGRVRFSGSVGDLRTGSRQVIHLHTNDDETAAMLASRQPNLTLTTRHEDGMQIEGSAEVVDRYIVDLGRLGIAVRRLEPQTQTLEAAFLDMTSAPSAPAEPDGTNRPAPTPDPSLTNSRRVGAHPRATVTGTLAVLRAECLKLRARRWAQACLGLLFAAPWVFSAAMRVQESVPEDTLFGRSVKESGFATPLVVLGFSSLWILPIVGALVAGDVFSAEDRHGTWSVLLTRSRTRSSVFAGKLCVALVSAAAGVGALGLSSLAAGVIVIGHQPLVDLSGELASPAEAAFRSAASWMTVVPPVFTFAACAVLVSIRSRSSTAGIGVPVVVGLVLQLYAFVNGPEVVRRLVVTSAFGAWHGLLTQPRYYRPLVDATVVSLTYCAIAIVSGYRIFLNRDIT
jgi:ABC-2 type transport system ATP-binding protein